MKGLFIGINYVGTSNELKGCINDVTTISQLYKKIYGLTNVRILIDNGPENVFPTKKNILDGIEWLISDNKSGEQLFFHYSGHGSYVTDKNNDESDRKDECIIPCDFNTNGFIIDDELNEKLARKVGNAYLFAVIDGCHSGTALDLNYNYVLGEIVRKSNNNTNTSPALNVVLLSGCSDSQTSADTTEIINTKIINCGALSWSLFHVLSTNPGINFISLINNIRKLLSTSRYQQIPQLSFNVPPNLHDKVIRGDITQQ